MKQTRLGYASNDYLNSIMEECIAAEKRSQQLDRDARAAGATFGTWTLAKVSTIGWQTTDSMPY